MVSYLAGLIHLSKRLQGGERIMKKLVAMLLAGAMVFSMAACGSNGNNNASDGTKGTDSQKEEGNSE